MEVVLYWMHSERGTQACLEVLSNPQQVFATSLSDYLGLFGLTCLMELPVYGLVYERRRDLVSRWRFLGLVLALNLATHPLVYFGFPSFWAAAGGSRAQMVASAELFAPLVEAGILASLDRARWKRAIVAAFLANLVSWWLGSLLV